MSKNRLLQHEQEHQKKAFESYYSLGEKRSYKKVAAQMGVSPHTVKLWSHSFGWRERVRERDADIARRAADRAIQSGADELDRNKKITHMAVMRLAKAIADGKVRMQMGDLDRLIRLQAFLEGYSQDRPRPRTAKEMSAYIEELISQCPTYILREMLEELDSDSENPEHDSEHGLPPDSVKG